MRTDKMQKQILVGIIMLFGIIQSEGAFSGVQKQFQQQMLAAHNRFRVRHCVSPLRLDDNLSRSAQRYAEVLARTNTVKHSGTKGIGENLYMMSNSQKITKVDGK